MESFIKEFLLQLGRCPELVKSNYYMSEQARQQLIMRVSKILSN